MSEIKVGDLVYIARRNYCGCDKGIGLTFIVENIDTSPRINFCNWCGFVYSAEDQAAGNGHGAQLWRLRKINPLSEPESLELEHKEELPA